MNVAEITTEELLKAIERGQEVQILDVRAPHRLATGHIDAVPEERFFNFPGSQIMAMEDVKEATGLDPKNPVAVVCGHGNASKPIATLLSGMGFDAKSLRGGMAGWMMGAVGRTLKTPDSLDHFVQFDRVGKGSLAYMLVSEGKALVIDPARNINPYLDLAKELDAEIVGVADTHVHADYISGATALQQELNIPYYLHPKDNAHVYEGTPGKLDITPVEDGAVIEFGRATITVMHTPGHTEGSVVFRLGDDAAFTGDFIFVESLGRPDLGGQVGPWTKLLWASLERAKKELQNHTMIYPAHYSSDKERQENRSIGAAWGDILAANEAVQIADESQFTEWVESRNANFPEAYRSIKVINVGLLSVTPAEAEVLEVGKNECAVV